MCLPPENAGAVGTGVFLEPFMKLILVSLPVKLALEFGVAETAPVRTCRRPAVNSAALDGCRMDHLIALSGGSVSIEGVRDEREVTEVAAVDTTLAVDVESRELAVFTERRVLSGNWSVRARMMSWYLGSSETAVEKESEVFGSKGASGARNTDGPP